MGERALRPVAVMMIFSVLALIGMPQFILIAATVVVFGPWLGALYSWLATMASALFGFALGRVLAQRAFARYAGRRLNQASQIVADHGILSSALVRNIPSAPFIVLNVAAGASPMSSAKFVIGTAIGILPKIVFISLIGTGALALFTHWNPEDFFLIVALTVLWVGLGLALRRLSARPRPERGAKGPKSRARATSRPRTEADTSVCPTVLLLFEERASAPPARMRNGGSQ